MGGTTITMDLAGDRTMMPANQSRDSTSRVFRLNSREIVSRASAHNGVLPLINYPPERPRKGDTLADQICYNKGLSLRPFEPKSQNRGVPPTRIKFINPYLRRRHCGRSMKYSLSTSLGILKWLASRVSLMMLIHRRDARLNLLVSLRADREEFLDRDFSNPRLNPVKVLQSLRANFSSAPTELQPIPAVVEFDVNDPRFIEEQDIISCLNEATNFVDLTPVAFEQLVTNLFNKMGFEACPYKDRKMGESTVLPTTKNSSLAESMSSRRSWTRTVQVDAVRDLFGAMDHERANKGILVTTSRFAPACYKFAEDKPLQLFDGSNLLALIEKYTNLKVRIVMPPPRKS